MPGRYYLSLEFLMGRSLMKNAYNLGLLPQLGRRWSTWASRRPTSLNRPGRRPGQRRPGPPGRLLSDSMTPWDPATGYSICYSWASSSRRSWRASR
ncbi:MAG: hypothetical protein ACLTYN_06240 [Dysosmobacter welbionis]